MGKVLDSFWQKHQPPHDEVRNMEEMGVLVGGENFSTGNMVEKINL